MGVINLEKDVDLLPNLEKAGDRLVVIDFFAQWCGPCQNIAPVFERLSDKYTDVIFMKVNVDICTEVARREGIRAMPTFVFYRNKVKLDLIRGADPNLLETKIRQFSECGQLFDNKPYASNIVIKERAFFQQVLGLSEKSINYEDPVMQMMAISVIPLEKLEKEAELLMGPKWTAAQFRDVLLSHLLQWFKCDFFVWIDAPSCQNCGKTAIQSDEKMIATSEELADGASIIEAYFCEICKLPVRFPRYNNPGKLIETRKGRCGEWANCFTLCARALGFETRFIHDQTDHVWTEVWSTAKDRWIHCDPCENICDRPLLYEQGWGKKLSYVLAFSIDEVVDVSWRYSLDHRAMLDRRLQCREQKLIEFLHKLNDGKRATMTAERRQELNRRKLNELVEMISPKLQIRDEAEQGRTSGSLAWRRQRRELGLDCQAEKALDECSKSVAIEIREDELCAGEYVFVYRCGRDEYFRSNNEQPIKGWTSLVFDCANIERKEESDWKMTYLARCQSPFQQSAYVIWKFLLPPIPSRLLSARVHFSRKTFHKASVRVELCCHNTWHLISDEDFSLNATQLSECRELKVKACLEGGEGPCFWQHAQLFRTPIGSTEDTFRLQLNFISSENESGQPD